MNRAILYSRVSDAKQKDGISLEMQVMDMVSYAARMGYTVVGREQDVMTAYDTMNERPSLLRVRQALRDKTADIVIVWKSDRLSRDMADALWLQKELVMVGARLESATEGAIESTPLGKFLMAARTFGAETERASITLRTQTALRRYAEAGRILASRQAKYGWQFTRNEKHKAVGYELHEENAAVMRRAYELVAAGLSLARVCKAFNDEGIPTPMGKGLWNRASLWSMLRDESFKGEHAAYRRTQVKRQIVVNGVVKTVKSMVKVPESEVIHQSIPAIVDAELWARVNARMPQNKSEATRHNRDVDLPLLRAGFGFCGYCHHPMYGNSTYRSGFHVYQCSHRTTAMDDASKVCPAKAFSLKAVDVDTQVWAAVCEIAKDRDKIERLVASRRQELESAVADRRQEEQEQRELLEESTRQRANLVKRIAR
jgi:site-specific DNA recombinase